MGGRSAEIVPRSTRCSQTRGVQLYVAFVPTTGGDVPQSFTQATFEQNGLGGNDMLLLVATDDHRYAWWENGAVPSLQSNDIDQLLSRTLEPRFRAGDYPGGVVDFADGLAAALGGSVPATAARARPRADHARPPRPRHRAGPRSPGRGRASSSAIVLLLAGLSAALGLVATAPAGRLTAEERDRRTGELARQANALLIAADDAVRDGQQELGFAEAEFDPADVDPLRAALTAAQAELTAAFTVRQQLDDEIPEDADTRERMLTEIVERSTRLTGQLDEQHKRLAALREQAAQAPQALAAMPDRIQALEARLPATEATVERLRAYADTETHPVRGNLEEARKRIAAASGGGRARSGIAAGDTTRCQDRRPIGPARAARPRRGDRACWTRSIAWRPRSTTPTAVSTARSPQPNPTSSRRSPRTSRRRPPPTWRRGWPRRRSSSPRQRRRPPRPRLPSWPRSRMRRPPTRRPTRSSPRCGRPRSSARANERRSTPPLRTAEASVARAQDFVATRRNGVDREARTRLAEAQRHLELAKSPVGGDPVAAANEARLAAQLADQAYDLARSDFDDWDRGGGRRRGPDLGQVILGGIILGNVLGGMGRRGGGGGWGGTPWGLPGGGRGGGGSWGGFGGGGGLAAEVAEAAAEVGDASAGPGTCRPDLMEPVLEAARSQTMAQTTILGRIGQLLRANVNSLLDGAEDPEKMLDQLIRDYTNNMAEAEEAVAQTIGNLRLVEDDAKEARAAAAEWGSKAAAASQQGRRDARRRQHDRGRPVRQPGQARPPSPAQLRAADQDVRRPRSPTRPSSSTSSRTASTSCASEREELVQKRDELVSRAKMAQAQTQVQQTAQDASRSWIRRSELNRFEERIRRQEAMARGMEEVASSLARRAVRQARRRGGRPRGRGPAGRDEVADAAAGLRLGSARARVDAGRAPPPRPRPAR